VKGAGLRRLIACAPAGALRLSRRTLLTAGMLGVLGSALAPWSTMAHADGAGIPGQVMIILGNPEGTGVAPELAKIEALKQAPFDAFPKKALLKRVDVSLSPGSDSEVELPNGRKLRLSLLEKTKEGRYRVSVSINRPGKQDYLPVMTVVAAPGDPFFVAGQKFEGGTLIIGVSVGKTG
jgi:hypothetical protein